MPCKASIRQVGDVAIVDLSGRITLGDGSGVVRETVKDMLKGGQKNLLLNLGDVSYIDSSGLGELVGAYRYGCEPRCPDQAAERRRRPSSASHFNLACCERRLRAASHGVRIM